MAQFLMRSGPVKVIRRDGDEDKSVEQQQSTQKENIMQNANGHQEQRPLTKKPSMPKIINFDKVKDLIRKSSRERLLDTAKHIKENKEEVLTRTASVMNFKQKHLQEFFEGTSESHRMTPIMQD